MKSVFVYLLGFIVSSYAFFAGDFVIEVVGIDKRLNMSRKYANWHTGMTRRGRQSPAMYGQFQIKHPIRKPVVLWKTYIWSNGKWAKFAFDMLSKMSICKEEYKKKYYDPYFEGDSVWVFPECTMMPGHMNISEKNAIDVSAITHDFVDRAPYGRFKIHTTVESETDDLIFGGLETIIDIKPPKKGKPKH